MKCLICKKEIIKKNNKCNNQKYCSIKCRYIKYRDRVNEWQRNRLGQKADNQIQCLICGKWYRQVGTHIIQIHKITAREYREEYGFDVKRGQLPEDLRELKKKQVFENGTVENLKKGKINWFKKGQKGVGIYKRSEQTMERLKNLHKLRK